MNRQTFIKNALQASAVIAVSPTSFLQSQPNKKSTGTDHRMMARLLAANDKQVALLLAQNNTGTIAPTRQTGFDFAAIASAYCSPQSAYYHHAEAIGLMQKIVAQLISFQDADGNLNFFNLGSPPDTSFLLEPFTAGAFLLQKETTETLAKLQADIKKFVQQCGSALAIGGVHTPNHRWVVCAALAHINQLFPNKKYTDRIADWLGEGMYNDTDGHYPERSVNYANVENRSMITLARLLSMPALLEPVRKNLSMLYYYMDPNGDVITTDSRRQDQYKNKNIVAFYLHYRYMAINDNSAQFAGIAALIEGMDGFDDLVADSYSHFLDNPLLQNLLPQSVPPATDYEKLFTTSSLLRIRRNTTTSTLFGGVDWPLIIASGRSDSPNFFSFRKGNAALKYMRLSCDFFSTGYFYSKGITQKNGQYILHNKLEVPYYQPLPKQLRKKDGDYVLSPSTDNRFWNKMDFKNRPVSNIKVLETTVLFEEKTGVNELTFLVNGQAGVRVTIELCFLEGGILTGVANCQDGNYFLEGGTGTYSIGGDSINFGPGKLAHKIINGLEGERYSTHFGSLKTEGMHVFLTGITPFEHTVAFS